MVPYLEQNYHLQLMQLSAARGLASSFTPGDYINSTAAYTRISSFLMPVEPNLRQSGQGPLHPGERHPDRLCGEHGDDDPST